MPRALSERNTRITLVFQPAINPSFQYATTANLGQDKGSIDIEYKYVVVREIFRLNVVVSFHRLIINMS